MESLVVHFSLVLARVASFVAVLPAFGGLALPRLVKAGLAMALSSFWFLLPVETRLVTQAQSSWLILGFLLGREALLGALWGFVFNLFLIPARIAGEYLTQEMGLSFGNQVNPAENTSTGAFTRILEVLVSALFFGYDGHHYFLAVLYRSFERLPVGGSYTLHALPQVLTGTALTAEWGLLLAAPVALCLFLSTVVLSLMTRAAPALNLYTVGFPLRIAMGLAASLLLLPNLVALLMHYLSSSTNFLTPVGGP